MKKRTFAIFVVAAWFAVTGPAFAQQPGDSGFYVGGGIGINSLDPFDDATGFQFFGGYDLAKAGFRAPPFKLAVEAGYMTSGTFEAGGFFGDFKVDGLWGTAVASYPVNPQFDLLGRLGLDIGDDDGLMFGIGAGFNIDKQMQLRGEYVIRDNLDSLQINLAFRL